MRIKVPTDFSLTSRHKISHFDLLKPCARGIYHKKYTTYVTSKDKKCKYVIISIKTEN